MKVKFVKRIIAYNSGMTTVAHISLRLKLFGLPVSLKKPEYDLGIYDAKYYDFPFVPATIVKTYISNLRIRYIYGLIVIDMNNDLYHIIFDQKFEEKEPVEWYPSGEPSGWVNVATPYEWFIPEVPKTWEEIKPTIYFSTAVSHIQALIPG